VVSEYGDWEYYAMNAGLNQDRWDDMLAEERSSRQLRSCGVERLMQQVTNIQEAHNDNFKTPAFADAYWVMFDYNRGYADNLEASGIMDIFRLPKPSYYFFQSQLPLDGPFGTPMVHIAGPVKKNGRGEVLIFSNCDEVEFWVDGKSLGRKGPLQDRISDHLAHPPFRFIMNEMEYRVLEAFGFVDGNQVTRSIQRNPGEPSALNIRVDLSGKSLQAACNDVVFVHACLVDSTETIIPENNIPVSFQVSGPAELIGDNPANLEAGIASILLRAGSKPGKITIRANLRDLDEVSFELESTGKN
jgi:beta-galactosidase